MVRLRCLSLLLVWGVAAWAQMATPDVHLEPHEGKMSFYLGEPIVVDLVFRNATGTPMTMNESDYGDMSESVRIEPADGWMLWRGKSAHDYASIMDLTANPVRLAVRLNDSYVFRVAGNYLVAVTTGRVRGGTFEHPTKLPAVTTNYVSIVLKAMPDGMEAERVRSIRNDLANGGAQRRAAMERLSTLQGDASLEEKAHLIVKGDNGFQPYVPVAVASTTNLQRLLDLLQAAWRDPAATPQFGLPVAMDEARRLMANQPLRGWTMGSAPQKPSEAETKLAQAHQRDMQDLLTSMPRRSGQNRTSTAYYLLAYAGLTGSDLQAAHEYAVEEYPHMDADMQRTLLQTARPPLRDARLLPDLRLAFEKKPSDAETLRALLELTTGEEQKSLVVHAVCATGYPVSLQSLDAFHGDRLPEVDACLLAHIATVDSNLWGLTAQLAARFATPETLPALQREAQGTDRASGLLAILMRMAPGEAGRLIVRRPGVEFYAASSVYNSLHQPFPPEAVSGIRSALPGASLQDQRSLAYELSLYGDASDAALVEKQLLLLRKSWSNRVRELQTNTDWDTPAGQARAGERDLISSLVNAKAWKLSDDAVRSLAAGCITDDCRQFARRHEEAKPAQ